MLRVRATFIPPAPRRPGARLRAPGQRQVPAGDVYKVYPFGRIAHAFGRLREGESFCWYFSHGHNGSFRQSNMALLLQKGARGWFLPWLRIFATATRYRWMDGRPLRILSFRHVERSAPPGSEAGPRRRRLGVLRRAQMAGWSPRAHREIRFRDDGAGLDRTRLSGVLSRQARALESEGQLKQAPLPEACEPGTAALRRMGSAGGFPLVIHMRK
jgi:hypothetical protein